MDAFFQLGASERLFASFRRFTATNVVRVTALEGSLPPARLQNALVALKARHPLLSVQLAARGAPAFVDAGAGGIPLIVHPRRDGAHFRELLEALLNRPLPARDGPLLQVHYVYAPTQPHAEMLLVADHVICDGVSMNALSAELLALASGEPAGAARPARGPLTALLPAFPARVRVRAFARQLSRFAGMTALRRALDRVPGGATTCFESDVLSHAETDALRMRARAEGTTVTGALMAAALIAAQAQRGTPRLGLSVPVNLRPRLARAGLTASDLGNYTNVAYLVARRSDALWPLARALKATLSEVTADEALLAPLPLVYRAGRLFVRARRPPFAHALVSSSGIVPLAEDYGAFRARDFYSATSSAMLSADLGFFCNTFDGRLRLNLVFAEEVLSREAARAALAKARDVLASARAESRNAVTI
ncbi:MAG: hypothetical protein ABW252_05660 [Polyangiales bacterium]